MPDLIDRLGPIFSHIKAVRTVYYHTIDFAVILVRVHDPFRNNDRFWIADAGPYVHNATKSQRSRPVVPHPKMKIGWPEKTKQVRLADGFHDEVFLEKLLD